MRHTSPPAKREATNLPSVPPLRHRYPYPIIVAAIAVVTGAMLSVPFMDPTVTTIGLALTAASTVCAAARPVISALILNNAKETGLTPIPLLWRDAPPSRLLYPRPSRRRTLPLR